MFARRGILGLFLLCGLAAAGAARAAMPVDVPCDPAPGKPTGFKRSCEDVINGDKLNPPQQPLPPLAPICNGVLECLDWQLKRYVDGYYSGQILDTSLADPTKSPQFKTPTCNLLGSLYYNPQTGEGNAVPYKNHLSQGCGDPILIRIQAQCGSCDACAIGCDCSDQSCCEGKVKAGIKLSMLLDYSLPTSGTLEAAYMRGGWLASLECHAKEVQNEISKYKKLLDLSPKCAALGASMLGLSKSADGIAKAIDADLAAASGKNNSDTEIWKCGIDPETTDKNGSDPDAGIRRQSAQQLCAARAGMEAFFMNLALCETLERAQIGYDKQFNATAVAQHLKNISTSMSDPAGEIHLACKATLSADTITDDCKNYVSPTTGEKCFNKDEACAFGICTTTGAQVHGNACAECVADTLTQRINTCYKIQAPKYFQKILKDNWDWTTISTSGGKCT